VKKIIDIITLPFFITLFFVDRVILLFVWNETGHKLKRWLNTEVYMLNSAIRVMIFLTVIMFVSIFMLSDFN